MTTHDVTADDLETWILDNDRNLIWDTMATADAVANRHGDGAGRLLDPPRPYLQRALAARLLPVKYAALLTDLREPARIANGPEIVPAPPYVTTASTGPVLRLPAGEDRILIRMALFRVTDAGPVYQRVGQTPEAVLTVTRIPDERPA